ncbi:20656_t:CDS:2, partial [Racocetra persica]
TECRGGGQVCNDTTECCILSMGMSTEQAPEGACIEKPTEDKNCGGIALKCGQPYLSNGPCCAPGVKFNDMCYCATGINSCFSNNDCKTST